MSFPFAHFAGSVVNGQYFLGFRCASAPGFMFTEALRGLMHPLSGNGKQKSYPH
jgi:hypothetical protein